MTCCVEELEHASSGELDGISLAKVQIAVAFFLIL